MMPMSVVPASRIFSGDSSARRRRASRRTSARRLRSRAYSGTITYLAMSLTYATASPPTGARGTTRPRPCETRVVERSSTGVSNSSDRSNAQATKS